MNTIGEWTLNKVAFGRIGFCGNHLYKEVYPLPMENTQAYHSLGEYITARSGATTEYGF